MAARSGLLPLGLAALLLLAPPSEALDRPVVASVHAGRLTLEAENHPWADVLDALRRATGAVFQVNVDRSASVTVSLVDVELRHALHTLFGNVAGLVIVYDGSDRGPASMPSRIRVLGPVTSPAIARQEPSGEAAVAVSAHGIRSMDPGVRAETARLLAGAGNRDAVAALGELLASDTDLEARSAAVASLARIGTPQALGTLRVALADEDPTLRIRAIEALAEVGSAQALAIVREAVNDAREEVRDAALAALPTRDIR